MYLGVQWAQSTIVVAHSGQVSALTLEMESFPNTAAVLLRNTVHVYNYIEPFGVCYVDSLYKMYYSMSQLCMCIL